MHWYDDLPHVGYDIDGKKVLRPARGDELDKFLQTVDNPSSWFVIHIVRQLLNLILWKEYRLRQNCPNG
jgi:hypothetical protein